MPEVEITREYAKHVVSRQRETIWNYPDVVGFFGTEDDAGRGVIKIFTKVSVRPPEIPACIEGVPVVWGVGEPVRLDDGEPE